MNAFYNHIHYLLDLHAYTHAGTPDDDPDVVGCRERAEVWRRQMTAGQREVAGRVNELLVEAREEHERESKSVGMVGETVGEG